MPATKLRAGISALAALALVILAGCAAKTEPASETGSMLFTQLARSGSFVPKGDGHFDLVLKGVSHSTVEFADRPKRTAETASTAQFIAAWDSTFGTDAPNAALVLTGADPRADTVIIAISRPRYDATSEELRFDAKLILNERPRNLAEFAEHADTQLPETFQAAALFIDGGNATQADDSPPLKVVFTNNSGRPDSDIYVALTDGKPGEHAPVAVTTTAGVAKQYAVPLATLPYLTDGPGPRYFKLDYGAEPGHTVGSLIWLAYGYGENPNLEVSPTAPSPDYASAVGKTRFANVEQAYVAPTAVNQGDTTYVNQYSIPMDIESCDANGQSCQGLYMKYYTDCVTEAMKAEVARFGGTWTGAGGVAHYDSAGNFIRITSPDTNPTGWPVLSDYARSLAGKSFEIHNSFGTVDSTKPTSTAFPTEEGYYHYTGTMREDGTTVLTGTIARQVNGPDPRPGRTGDVVTIEAKDLPPAIYSQAGNYSATGPDASAPNNNDAYNSIYADFVTGLTSGYWGGKYGNDNRTFGQSGNAPFAAARPSGERFLGYSPYSEVMWNYSNAYSMPYGERYNNGGHPSPLVDLESGGQWKVTIHPDITPGGCAGSWQPG